MDASSNTSHTTVISMTGIWICVACMYACMHVCMYVCMCVRVAHGPRTCCRSGRRLFGRRCGLPHFAAWLPRCRSADGPLWRYVCALVSEGVCFFVCRLHLWFLLCMIRNCARKFSMCKKYNVWNMAANINHLTLLNPRMTRCMVKGAITAFLMMQGFKTGTLNFGSFVVTKPQTSS